MLLQSLWRRLHVVIALGHHILEEQQLISEQLLCLAVTCILQVQHSFIQGQLCIPLSKHVIEQIIDGIKDVSSHWELFLILQHILELYCVPWEINQQKK